MSTSPAAWAYWVSPKSTPQGRTAGSSSRERWSVREQRDGERRESLWRQAGHRSVLRTGCGELEDVTDPRPASDWPEHPYPGDWPDHSYVVDDDAMVHRI